MLVSVVRAMSRLQNIGRKSVPICVFFAIKRFGFTAPIGSVKLAIWNLLLAGAEPADMRVG